MKSISELENKLSEPSEELVYDLKRLEGDILILGLGGKMGPSLAKLAVRALKEGGVDKKIIGVSRFSKAGLREELEEYGVQTIAGDLLDESFLAALPQCENVLFMAGRKFGTSGNESYTWAMNTYLPGRVAEKYKDARIVVFSSGNVYPFVSVESKGAGETTPPAPLGEYAQSCLGRERIFEYFSLKYGAPVLLFRLNYAIDLRYGVLNEIARAVWNNQLIDLTTGYANVVWQGDANAYALRCLHHCRSPARILNVAGPERVSIEWLAGQFAERMNKKARFTGKSADTALLNDASAVHKLLGSPKVSLYQLIEWTTEWVVSGGEDLGKPTHFQERKGRF